MTPEENKQENRVFALIVLAFVIYVILIYVLIFKI